MNETIQTIQSLRTVREAFTDRHISDEDLQTILDSAVRAANASNRQSYSIVVTFDQKKIKTLCGYTGDCLLVFCVDYTRLVDMAKQMGRDFDAADALDFVTGSTDTILAAQTACIAAKSLGIDSIFSNNLHHRGDPAHVYQALDLPQEQCFPLVGLVLGYTAAQPPTLRGRLSGPGVVHLEKYQRLTAEERQALVAEYDDPKRQLALNPDWRKEGAVHYLDWYYAKWTRHFDAKPFLAALQRAGFIPRAKDAN